MKAVTKLNIGEIAQLAGVSTATVSRVINNAECVKKKTREKVMQVIREYDYIPSEVARGLSRKNSKVIGVVFPDLENPFYYGLLQGITEVAEAHGYNVMMFYTDEDPEKEREVLRVAKGKDLAGLIITAAGVEMEETGEILQTYDDAQIPVVLLDRVLKGRNFTSVLADNEEGSYQAVSRLIEEGHSRIALIEGNPAYRPVLERAIGYKRAMEEHKIAIEPDYIIRANQKSQLAYEGMKRLLELPIPPTAVFTCNNMMTLGALRALTEKKVRIGEDISIIGFDDIKILNTIDYKLSVVDRSEQDMGRLAMKAILGRLSESEELQDEYIVPTKLILRGSERIESI